MKNEKQTWEKANGSGSCAMAWYITTERLECPRSKGGGVVEFTRLCVSHGLQYYIRIPKK